MIDAVMGNEAVVSNTHEIRALTTDELGEAAGGMFPPGPTVVDAGVFQVAGVIIHD